MLELLSFDTFVHVVWEVKNKVHGWEEKVVLKDIWEGKQIL